MLKQRRLEYIKKREDIINAYAIKLKNLGIDYLDTRPDQETTKEKIYNERSIELDNLEFPFNDRYELTNFEIAKRLFEKDNPEIFTEIANWSTINKSPYSNSFYDSNDIDWGNKPSNSRRVSDHWNFGDDNKHCKTNNDLKNGWALGVFKNGIYNIERMF